ncbi:MAG: flagellar filament capping protein FliD [Planctomycetota bacterium]|nr:flagellar filament capping protein FliD [Planctomycetota bacterium]
MSGITSSIGLFSGIDTASLIDQLISLDARPRTLAQNRIFDLQVQQSAYLDINSRLSALQTAARRFRTEFTFDSMKATSSDTSILSAVGSRIAVPGNYSFIVDRLVSSQQALSRGFSDASSSAINASQFTFESAEGRLDRDIALADLNDGEGVQRGKIVIVQGSESATVDLSKAVTINDVLDAINSSGLDITATTTNGALELSGGSDFSVTSSTGYTTAESLGIAGTSSGNTLTGDTVYELTGNTTLGQLNDGNGVFIGTDIGEERSDFTISVDVGSGVIVDVDVNLGSVWETIDGELTETAGAVTNMQGVVDRITTAIDDAGISAIASASISNGSLVLTNALGNDITTTEAFSGTTTAADLGILGTATGTLTGTQQLAGLNTTLVSNLNGGSGLAGDGILSFTARDGTAFAIDVSAAHSVNDIINLINDDAGNGGRVTVSLSDIGSGLLVTDSTGGSSNLIITGDTAVSLGIGTDVTGVPEDTVTGTSLQHKYFSMSTSLDDLNNGTGVGTGEFRITDGNSVSFTIDIGSDAETVYDLVREIQGQADAAGANINVRINDKGDGLLIEEKSSEPDGGTTITIEDLSGTVAKNLNIAGVSEGTGDDNFIDGSAEVIVQFDATDTLNDIAQKINDASGSPVRATIINDGTGSNPYRLSLSARATGVDGRFIVDDGGLGLKLSTLDEGNDARVFYGSSDPAKAVLLTNSTNTLDGVIPGVTIDLNNASEDVVNLTITRDTDQIITAIEEFITAYNDVFTRIDFQTRYDPETEIRGPLLGESTLSILRSNMSRTSLAKPLGVDDEFESLSQVGITVTDGGKLTLDRDKLRDAMEQDFEAVADLFAAREQVQQDTETEIEDGIFVRNTNLQDQFSKLGIIFQFEELADRYLDSVDGIFANKDQTFTDQIELQEKRIEQFNVQLAAKRVRLERQFLAMERALASLSSQQGALTSLQG